MSKSRITEEELNRLLSHWHQHNKDAADDVERLLKEHEKKDWEEGWREKINIDYRKSVIAFINLILSQVLLIVIIGLASSGEFRNAQVTTPLILIVTIYLMLSQRYKIGLPIKGPLIPLFVGVFLLLISYAGADFITGTSQVMAAIGSQILAAAFVGGLILMINKPREDRIFHTVIVVLYFMYGLVSILRVNPEVTSGPFLTIAMNLLGILGLETVGASITVILVSSWLEI
jgi:hypothetical protein